MLSETLRRIDRNARVCLEIRAGDGTENNTLVLASRGWRTVWIDARTLAIDPNCNPSILSCHQEFVDGATGHLASALLDDGLSPDLFNIETNEVLPPPARFAQRSVPNYVWD